MKVLVDTNVIIDALAAREPFREDAEAVLLLAAEERIAGFVTGSSMTDIYYLIRRKLSHAEALDALRTLESVDRSHLGAFLPHSRCSSPVFLANSAYSLRKPSLISTNATKKSPSKHSCPQTLMQTLGVVSVGEDECRDAMQAGMGDFEDAVAAVCAGRVRADFIVTRDGEFARKGCAIPVVSPAEILERVGRR